MNNRRFNDLLDEVERPSTHPLGAEGSPMRRAQEIGQRLLGRISQERDHAATYKGWLDEIASVMLGFDRGSRKPYSPDQLIGQVRRDHEDAERWRSLVSPPLLTTPPRQWIDHLVDVLAPEVEVTESWQKAIERVVAAHDQRRLAGMLSDSAIADAKRAGLAATFRNGDGLRSSICTAFVASGGALDETQFKMFEVAAPSEEHATRLTKIAGAAYDEVIDGKRSCPPGYTEDGGGIFRVVVDAVTQADRPAFLAAMTSDEACEAAWEAYNKRAQELGGDRAICELGTGCEMILAAGKAAGVEPAATERGRRATQAVPESTVCSVCHKPATHMGKYAAKYCTRHADEDCVSLDFSTTSTGEEKEAHARTQKHLDDFQGHVAELELKLASVVATLASKEAAEVAFSNGDRISLYKTQWYSAVTAAARALGLSEVPDLDPAHPHLVDGEFQSDKYPTTPRGKVPLSTEDPTAQDLLWTYAQRRRLVDAQFADDLEIALKARGYSPTPTDGARDMFHETASEGISRLAADRRRYGSPPWAGPNAKRDAAHLDALVAQGIGKVSLEGVSPPTAPTTIISKHEDGVTHTSVNGQPFTVVQTPTAPVDRIRIVGPDAERLKALINVGMPDVAVEAVQTAPSEPVTHCDHGIPLEAACHACAADNLLRSPSAKKPEEPAPKEPRRCPVTDAELTNMGWRKGNAAFRDQLLAWLFDELTDVKARLAAVETRR